MLRSLPKDETVCWMMFLWELLLPFSRRTSRSAPSEVIMWDPLQGLKHLLMFARARESRERVAWKACPFYLLFRFARLKSVFLHFSLQSDFLSMWSSQHGAVAQTFDWTTRCIYYLTGMDGGTVLTSPPKLTSKDQHDGHCSTLGRDYRVDMPVRLSFAH